MGPPRRRQGARDVVRSHRGQAPSVGGLFGRTTPCVRRVIGCPVPDCVPEGHLLHMQRSRPCDVCCGCLTLAAVLTAHTPLAHSGNFISHRTWTLRRSARLTSRRTDYARSGHSTRGTRGRTAGGYRWAVAWRSSCRAGGWPRGFLAWLRKRNCETLETCTQEAVLLSVRRSV